MQDHAGIRAGLRDAALVGALIGASGGLIELVLLGVLKFGLGRPLWLGLHVLWMTPLLTAALALGSMAAVWLLASRRPIAWRIGIAAAAFLAVWGVLLLVPGVHYLAAAILAAGIALRFGQSRLSAREPMVARARLLVPWLAGWIILAAGAVGLGRPLVERIRLGRLPDAAPALPNVLLITIDTERAQSLSLYGHRRVTSPVLDSVARQGTVFERAIAPSSWTLPSHASLFTGRYPHELSAEWRTPLDTRTPTLAERLSRAGYHTAGFVANTYYCSRDFGLARGFLHYEDYVFSFEELLLSSAVLRKVLHLGTLREVIGFPGVLARRSGEDINRSFLRWLDRRGERPFFAFLNYFDVHEPYAPSSRFEAEFQRGARPDYSGADHRLRFAVVPDVRLQRLSASAHRVELDAYEGAIATIDREIGSLLRALERRGVLDRTVLIITSDHGEQFGEQVTRRNSRTLYRHGNSLYSQAIWVPLVLRYPAKVTAGIRIATPVSLRDIPATIAALTGAFAAAAVPGVSLSELWSPAGSKSTSPALSTVIPPRKVDAGGWIASLVTEQYHYIRYGTGEVEVFRHPIDPEDSRNRAAELRGTPSGMMLLDSLAAGLRQQIGDWPRGR